MNSKCGEKNKLKILLECIDNVNSKFFVKTFDRELAPSILLMDSKSEKLMSVDSCFKLDTNTKKNEF
jgi:hypothetical protein